MPERLIPGAAGRCIGRPNNTPVSTSGPCIDGSAGMVVKNYGLTIRVAPPLMGVTQSIGEVKVIFSTSIGPKYSLITIRCCPHRTWSAPAGCGVEQRIEPVDDAEES